MAENTEHQQQMLHDYQQELDTLAVRWGNDANQRAEHILNAALTASREVMETVLHDSAKMMAQMIEQTVENTDCSGTVAARWLLYGIASKRLLRMKWIAYQHCIVIFTE